MSKYFRGFRVGALKGNSVSNTSSLSSAWNPTHANDGHGFFIFRTKLWVLGYKYWLFSSVLAAFRTVMIEEKNVGIVRP